MNQAKSDLQNNVASQILERISKGAIEPGAHLSELRLAQEFGVSRTPIRKALQILQGHGILQQEKNKGFYLAEVPKGQGASATLLEPSKEDRLYRAIASDRIGGDLPDRIAEAELIRRYHVSRSVLTRVLNKMAEHGLVTRAAGHGWEFQPALLTEESHDESYRFRLIVEPAAFSEPTFQVDTGELERVRSRHLQLMNTGGPVPAAEMFDVNADFHEMIARFSHNRYILQSVVQQNRLRQLLEAKGLTDAARIRQSCIEHLEIIEAIEKGDLTFAKSLLSHHLTVASRLKLAFDRSEQR